MQTSQGLTVFLMCTSTLLNPLRNLYDNGSNSLIGYFCMCAKCKAERERMHSWIFIIVMEALYICSKVSVRGDSYNGELVMEGNVTLDVQNILESLATTKGLQVNNSNGASDTVTFSQNEVTAECLINGTDTNCNCSTDYTWSNTVCYNYNCCDYTTCKSNVSYITPLCVPKVHVQISGSVTLASTNWDSNKLALINNSLQGLNALQYWNVTNSTNKTVDFQATVSVRIETSILQEKFNSLQTNLNATIMFKTTGMVTILSPNTTVCYKSRPVLKCTLEETEGRSRTLEWTLNQIALNPGSVVQLNNSCAQRAGGSCSALTVNSVTDVWIGTYECRFIDGSVTHLARAQLNVALLPDMINMETSTADCSQQASVQIKISAIIPKSTEKYEVWWSYRGIWNSTSPTSQQNYLVYTFNANFCCQTPSEPQSVNVTFKNTKGQTTTQQVNIPVIYAQSKFCKDDDIWPKTPNGSTVINHSCPANKSGYRSRYCDGTSWDSVFDNCVNKELISVLNDANNFLQGLGTTQEKATGIFQGLVKTSSSAFSPSVADISATITILNVMAKASGIVPLKEEILNTFAEAASNMVNQTWKAINNSILYSMSSNYLASVEDLVANIKVNTTKRVQPNSSILQLAFCSGSECNMSVFGIDVNINITKGTLKIFAVNSLSDKLNNTILNYSNTDGTTVLSATLQDNNDSSLKIKLDFPNNQRTQTEAFCVFWNTTEKNWSNEGCTVSVSDENHTMCECNHLTPFSILFSKVEIHEPACNTTLDIITNVGLGVSICSLLIFLTVECLVWSAVVKTNLAHFRHTAMVNIATFLLLADISFLASSCPSVLPDIWCLILTICKHLFYLAMFCWMFCLSIMLVHQLIFVFSPLRKRVFMVFSSIVGYVFPVLIVGSSYVHSIYMKTSYYNEDCWLVFNGTLNGSIYYFLVPVGTIIFINVFCMLVIILTLLKSWVPEASKGDDKTTAKGMLKVMVILTPVLGITWIIGFFHLLWPQDLLKFCFTILNSFQGLFILLTGSFTEKKIREELYKILMKNSKGTQDSTKNLISTTDARVK